jgi:hypothetical protein
MFLDHVRFGRLEAWVDVHHYYRIEHHCRFKTPISIGFLNWHNQSDTDEGAHQWPVLEPAVTWFQKTQKTE